MPAFCVCVCVRTFVCSTLDTNPQEPPERNEIVGGASGRGDEAIRLRWSDVNGPGPPWAAPQVVGHNSGIHNLIITTRHKEPSDGPFKRKRSKRPSLSVKSPLYVCSRAERCPDPPTAAAALTFTSAELPAIVRPVGDAWRGLRRRSRT